MVCTTRGWNLTRAVAGALLVVAAAACGDDGTDPEPEPEVATIRVAVGTFTTDIPHTPSQCTAPNNTPIPLTVNQANSVSVRFLGADGQDEPIIVAERADLELGLGNTTGWTFTPTGGSGATFTANVTPTTTGSFIPRLELENTEHGHNEVECLIRVTVSQ